jgi:uncharacterized phage protein (TIGR02218 family)
MAGPDPALAAHLAGGVTTLARVWAIVRRDGVSLGFTDHDRDLAFDGVVFRAETGLTAQALQQSTGLSIDNTEALGALTAAGITEADIEAGRFDGAEVRAWLVNWADPAQRWLQFCGTMGEITRIDGAFRADLRGLTEALNRPLGRVFQKPCTAVLGDAACRVDLTQPGYRADLAMADGDGITCFVWPALPGFDPGFFTRGRLDVLGGAAAGLWGIVKEDRAEGGQRAITLWTPLRARVSPGDTLRLTAGCDKRMETCRLKFANLLNFQGFPDIPGEDWMLAYPRSGNPNTGGSRR